MITEDSRPFTVLQKRAEDFKSLFNKGIETCLSTLDSGISDLLCDPDSLVGSSTNANRLSAHMEFSKAKYELFVKMREFFEKFETECVEQISEMKEMFLENVEIFLAGTKLEVKLPTSELLSQIEKKRSSGSNVHSGNSHTASPASSLYPKLFDSAKKQISRLGSFLPNANSSEIFDDDENQQSVFPPIRQNGRSPKKVTIVTPQEMEILEARILKKRNSASPMKETSSDSGSDCKSTNTPLRRKNARTGKKEVNKSINIDQKDTEDSLPQVEKIPRRAARFQLSTPTVSTPSSTSGKKTRTPRKKADVPEDSQQAQGDRKTPKNVHFSSDIDAKKDSAIQKSPNSVQFSVGMDIHEDLDVYSPDVKLSRATPRRKTTVLKKVVNDFAEIDITPGSTQKKSKRKTIAGSYFDEKVSPSPKRLRIKRMSNIAPSSSDEDEPMDSNFLASDRASEEENYSSWMPLSDISGSVPSQPGIYELKVSAAKKSAYIGACENLRQKLTLHKLTQNSGHKHLDKFIERNTSNILVRYEPLPSIIKAKSEKKIRVKAFVDRFKNSPAYN